MRFAIIDTGTNTFHLLIVERIENGFKKIFKIQISVKLGEDGITTNTISALPFERGINTFKKFKRICDEHNTTIIFATGTAALRRATNALEFIKKVKGATDIDLKIISGEEEATLIWNGVRHALNMGLHKSLIVDIGGGSVEFIVANEAQIFWKHSYDIGAALLLEKFNPTDPVTAEEISSIENFIDNQLRLLVEACKLHEPKTLIGSSGSFDTFAELIVYQFYNFDLLRDKTTYSFNMSDYEKIHQQLIHSTHEQRLQMKGMIPMRADMIVVASILLTFVLRKLNIDEMKLSTYALKEGVMYNMISNI